MPLSAAPPPGTERQPVLVHIGYENYLKTELVTAILQPGGAPVRRMREKADEKGMLINATCGKKTRSVVVLTAGQVFLSALQPATLRQRMESPQKDQRRKIPAASP